MGFNIDDALEKYCGGAENIAHAPTLIEKGILKYGKIVPINEMPLNRIFVNGDKDWYEASMFVKIKDEIREAVIDKYPWCSIGFKKGDIPTTIKDRYVLITDNDFCKKKFGCGISPTEIRIQLSQCLYETIKLE